VYNDTVLIIVPNKVSGLFLVCVQRYSIDTVHTTVNVLFSVCVQR